MQMDVFIACVRGASCTYNFRFIKVGSLSVYLAIQFGDREIVRSIRSLK